jgi:glycosyltransferase involved in cell wall biosynthesis
MASGCPVAAASSGSLPEVCGDSVVFFDPHDVTAIAQGVLDAMSAVSLLAHGGEPPTEFTWPRCASEHENVYRRTVAGA